MVVVVVPVTVVVVTVTVVVVVVVAVVVVTVAAAHQFMPGWQQGQTAQKELREQISCHESLA